MERQHLRDSEVAPSLGPAGDPMGRQYPPLSLQTTGDQAIRSAAESARTNTAGGAGGPGGHIP